MINGEMLFSNVCTMNCTRGERNQIRIEWTGVKTSKNATKIELFGKEMRRIIGGVEVMKKNNCNVLYNQCKAEGISKMQCPLEEGQVGQPINILVLMDANKDSEVCDIDMDLQWTVGMPGQSYIVDWDDFITSV